ncbi:MAG: nitrile hydratase accessory protein [Deltaproteobacteria bacterium]|nr:nitrile hydratase accessory protein [Deltaproteobacteria bacterium]
MTSDGRAQVLDWDGPLSPPRRNGELVFEALWESRVFGMTMTLYERGAFAWDEFRDRLIATIAAAERAAHPHAGAYRYWECWLGAFEALAADKAWCAPGAVDARLAELAARPAGHDHRTPGT